MRENTIFEKIWTGNSKNKSELKYTCALHVVIKTYHSLAVKETLVHEIELCSKLPKFCLFFLPHGTRLCVIQCNKIDLLYHDPHSEKKPCMPQWRSTLKACSYAFFHWALTSIRWRWERWRCFLCLVSEETEFLSGKSGARSPVFWLGDLAVLPRCLCGKYQGPVPQ